jgi:hypothetical protein
MSAVVIWGLALVTSIGAIAGIALGWIRYNRAELPDESGRWWARTLGGFGVDDFYGRAIVEPGKKASEVAAATDAKVLDGAAHGLGIGVRSFGSLLRPLQSGKVRSYAGALAIAGVILVVAMVLIGGGF